MPKSHHHQQIGFTMIELLVTLMLVGIILAIGVPSFNGFMSRYRLTTASNDFLSGITLTRNEAIRRSRRVDMIPANNAANWAAGWVIFIDTNNNQLLDSTETVIQQHPAIPATIAVSVPTNAVCPSNGAPVSPFSNGTRSFISYMGTGYPQAGSTVPNGIVFTDTNISTNTRTLCINVIGRPRIFGSN